MRREQDLHAADVSGREQQQVRGRLNALAWLLDNSIRLPGGFRIGLEALLGLVPFLGDAAGVLMSGYIVREAARIGVPRTVLTRMVMNVVVDGLLGMFPLLGDIFDAAYKANLRNVQLLNAYFDNPVKAARSSRLYVGILATVLIAFVLLMSVLWALLMRWMWNALSG